MVFQTNASGTGTSDIFILFHFPKSWKEAEVIKVQKPGNDPKLTQNLRPISLSSTTGKLF
jgi:hypothetical protein